MSYYLMPSTTTIMKVPGLGLGLPEVTASNSAVGR